MRSRLRAPNQGPLLQALLDPLNYVPQLWGDVVRGACFWSRSGTRFGVGPRTGPREGLCLASVAKAKESQPIMELPLPHQVGCRRRSPPCSSAVWQCFRAPRRRGPFERAVHSITNSSHHGDGGALDLDTLPTTHERQHEDPSRDWRVSFVERCENRPTWTSIHDRHLECEWMGSHVSLTHPSTIPSQFGSRFRVAHPRGGNWHDRSVFLSPEKCCACVHVWFFILMVLMCSEPPALCRASHSLQASRLCFVFDTSSSPLVVTMSSCSLMESFWLLQGIFHCFSLCRLHLSSHAATAPEVLRGLSSSSPNKRAADVHPQATLVSVRTSRAPVVRPGWAWSRGLPHPRGSTHPCATISTGACKISIDGFHEQGEGPVRIQSWCCHCPTTTTCRKSTTTTCEAHTFLSPALAEPTTSSSSVFVPGFGCKGEGKSANYGIAIAPPSLVADADRPVALQQPGSASELHMGARPPPPEIAIDSTTNCSHHGDGGTLDLD